MKLTFLLALFPLVAPAVSDRTKEEWVGDLQKITLDYEQIVNKSQRKDIKPDQFFVGVTLPLDQSRLHLSTASSFQKTAANPNAAHGYRVNSGSCVAMADYFPKVATAGIKAMDVILDPNFACSEIVKKKVRSKIAPWRGILRHINSLWDDYDSAYYVNCKDEPGAKIYLQQNYLPMKSKVQKASDAYQDIDGYCESQ